MTVNPSTISTELMSMSIEFRPDFEPVSPIRLSIMSLTKRPGSFCSFWNLRRMDAILIRLSCRSSAVANTFWIQHIDSPGKGMMEVLRSWRRHVLIPVGLLELLR